MKADRAALIDFFFENDDVVSREVVKGYHEDLKKIATMLMSDSAPILYFELIAKR